MSAFNNMYKLVRDRNWGGTDINITAEPYVSGYSFIHFLWMPQDLTQAMFDGNSLKGLNTVSQVKPGVGDHVTNVAENKEMAGKFLEHAMNSVTPPGGTINKIEIQGLGGSKWAVPGSMDYGNSLSIKYLEFSGLPITRIHRAWCNLIRDNRMGTTHMDNGGANHGGAYNKMNYAATIAYWTTKPDGCTVEFGAIYTGVFPTKDPMDLFSGDITSIDKLEIEIEYNVDMIYNDSKTLEYIQNNIATPGGAPSSKGPNGAQSATTWSGYTNRWDGDFGSRGQQEATRVMPNLKF